MSIEREPDVSMTIGMFLSRANLKTFSSLINYKDLHIFGLRKKERKKERKKGKITCFYFLDQAQQFAAQK
jgi:hypothetical protein